MTSDAMLKVKAQLPLLCQHIVQLKGKNGITEKTLTGKSAAQAKLKVVMETLNKDTPQSPSSCARIAYPATGLKPSQCLCCKSVSYNGSYWLQRAYVLTQSTQPPAHHSLSSATACQAEVLPLGLGPFALDLWLSSELEAATHEPHCIARVWMSRMFGHFSWAHSHIASYGFMSALVSYAFVGMLCVMV